MSERGAFVISLDFELHWGIFDHSPLNGERRAYFDRTRDLIPPTLELFERSGLAATWATVGLLFARHRGELMQMLPENLPAYADARLNPYALLDTVGEDESDDPYHYAPSLIERVRNTAGQRIGSHTFGHYYCLEPGQTVASFRADLRSAQRVSQATGSGEVRSLVFPRNQYREDYLGELPGLGFHTFRGNPVNWFWRVKSGKETGYLQRAVRLADNYLPLGASPVFELPDSEDRLVNVPASRFFRPYLSGIDGFGGQLLKVRRILREMTEAARSSRHYHLWWHPHNLATHPQKNMEALVAIAAHYVRLRDRYGWPSHSMESLLEARTK